MFPAAGIWRILIIVGLTCLHTACFLSTPTMPDWAKNKPTSPNLMYAVGQGVNLYDAEVNARASMAAQLSATVSDMTRIYMVDEGKFKQESYEQFTSVEVSKVNISHARVVKQEGSSGNYHVLLELPVAQLRKQLSSEVSSEVRVISRTLKTKKTNNFEYWWQLRSVLPNAKRMARNLRLLSDFNGQVYEKETKLLASYFERFDESFGNRAIGIKNLSNVRKLSSLVSEQLQLEGIELLQASRSKNQDRIEISIDYDTQRIGREYYVDAELWFRLKSSSGRVLSQFSIKDRGVSYSGNKQSKEIANQRLYNRLNSLKVFDRLLD